MHRMVRELTTERRSLLDGNLQFIEESTSGLPSRGRGILDPPRIAIPTLKKAGNLAGILQEKAMILLPTSKGCCFIHAAQISPHSNQRQTQLLRVLRISGPSYPIESCGVPPPYNIASLLSMSNTAIDRERRIHIEANLKFSLDVCSQVSHCWILHRATGRYLQVALLLYMVSCSSALLADS